MEEVWNSCAKVRRRGLGLLLMAKGGFKMRLKLLLRSEESRGTSVGLSYSSPTIHSNATLAAQLWQRNFATQLRNASSQRNHGSELQQRDHSSGLQQPSHSNTLQQRARVTCQRNANTPKNEATSGRMPCRWSACRLPSKTVEIGRRSWRSHLKE